MRFTKSLLLMLFVSSVVVTQAQDIHYSMFDMSPIELNSAYTGNYEGTFRIGGIYRSQWQGMALNTQDKFSGYQTPGAYIDVPFGFPKKKGGTMRNWAGVGVSFYSDKVGNLSNMGASLSLAYHLSLSKVNNTHLSIGAKGGILQSNYGVIGDYQFASDILGTGNTELVPEATTSVDFSASLLFTHKTDRGFNIEAGVTANHFTKIGERFGILANALVDIPLTGNFLLRPLTFFQYVEGAHETNVQVLLGYHFNEAKDVTLYFGGGYRLNTVSLGGDGGIIRLGLDLKGLRFGFAYDINATPLSKKIYTAGLNQGMGFEIGLSYIARLQKKPVVEPILFQPRF